MDSLQQGDKDSKQNSCEQETQSEVLDVHMMTKNPVEEVEKLKSKALSVERRASPRLQKISQDKKPYYGTDLRKHLVISNDKNNVRKREFNSHKGNAAKKKAKIEYPIQEQQPNVAREGVEDSDRSDCVPIRHDNTEIGDLEGDDSETVELEDDAYLKWTDYKGFLADSIRQNASEKVEETIKIFNKYCLHFAQEEDKRCQKPKAKDQKIGNGTSEHENSAVAKRSIRRPDLKATTEMLNKKEILYPEKIIGHLPGIAVGYKFNSRSEMVALGFHGHWLNGIDYISKFSGKLMKHYGYTCPLAVAIVMSGEYEGDVDYSNEVVYTGQGGTDFDHKGKEIKDQVMHRGNLALKNNMEQCVPVRFIRGHTLKAGCRSRKVYTYCGLYKVVNYWNEEGASGSTVFKYRLKQLLGQPKADIDQVQYGLTRVSKVSPALPGLVCKDISFGEEDIHIPVTNMIDSPPVAPAEFKYTKSVEVATNITVPPSATGCSCKENCTNPKSCSCARLNGCKFPYVKKNGGRLIEPKDVVYECGPGCGCGPNCINRVSQRGLKYRLEVYRVENKGWAVRSPDIIPSGAPVCEYTGVLRRNTDMDNVSENDYIFEIDCWHTMKGIGGRERRQNDVLGPTSDPRDKEDDNMAESDSEFCIDAGSSGNVARFINHSCEPNLFVQCVLNSHRDIRLARVVLFAADDIPAMQELAYDYGYALDSVIGPDGKIKLAPCFCGSKECRGRLF